MPFVVQNADGTFVGRRRKARWKNQPPSRIDNLQRATVWKNRGDAEYARDRFSDGGVIREVVLALAPEAPPS